MNVIQTYYMRLLLVNKYAYSDETTLFKSESINTSKSH